MSKSLFSENERGTWNSQLQFILKINIRLRLKSTVDANASSSARKNSVIKIARVGKDRETKTSKKCLAT